MSISSIQWEFIFGGLAIFLFGINLMGDGLTNFAGSKIRDYIDKYTSNPFKAILVGIVLTAVLQSSSATTVIAISLVRAGLMRLDQAIGISMGANIGTTITAVLISFQVEYFAYFIMLIGVIMTMAAKRKKHTYLAHILIGFSLIFIGLTMMGDALKQLQYLDGFNEIILSISSQPIIGLIGGTIITGIVQSSSAIVGITQKLYDTEAITLIVAISLVFGANIGTCVTSLIAAAGGSLAAKRSALFHLMFNAVGSIIFMIFLIPYTHLISALVDLFNLNNLMAIAMAHFLFNFISTLLFLPFVNLFVALMEKLLPGKEAHSLSDVAIEEFDESMITNFTAGALEVSKRSILKVGELVVSSIEASHLYIQTKDKKYKQTVVQLEDIVNALDTKITNYLLKIAKTNLSEELSIEYATNLQVIKNLERISDLSTNLVEFYEMIFEHKEDLTPTAKDELRQFYDLLVHNLNSALEIYQTNNFSSYQTLTEDENYIDLLEHQFRENFFQRITADENIADVAGSVYIDILGTLERMADHSYNVATNTVHPVKVHNIPKELHV